MKSATNISQLALDFDDAAAALAAPSTHDLTRSPTADLELLAGQPNDASVAALPNSMSRACNSRVMVASSIDVAGADLQAVETWIAAKCDDAERDSTGRPPNSANVYRREARRFVLWLRLERGVSLAEARLPDCLAYRAFLADPLPREKWCAPRGTRMGSPLWRPFEGPLCARARRQAITVLSCMFRFLQDQLYLAGNPWTGVAKPRTSEPRVDPGRSLSREQWSAVEQELQAGPQHLRARQLAWATRFLYATGLRLSEVAAANCGDLRWLAFDAPTPADPDGIDSGSAAGSWIIRVMGKGLKLRDVPVDACLVDELGELLSAHDGVNDPRNHADRPLLLRMPSKDGTANRGTQCRMSAQSLYRQLKQLFARAAQRMVQSGRHHDAAPLLRASTHWLRHTCGTHSVDAGVPLDVVSQSMGHANLQITSIYIAGGDLRRRARESSKLALSAARR
jgi:integrase